MDRAHEALGGIRVALDEFLRGHHAVGIEIETMIGVGKPARVLVGIELGLHQIDVDRIVEAQNAVDVVADQHRLLKIGGNVLEIDLAVVDAVDAREQRQQPRRGTAGRRPDGAALEILQRLDRSIGANHQCAGTSVVHLIDHARRLGRLLRGGRDQRVDIAEAGLVIAGHDAGDRCRRAFALVDHDIEPLLLEIALVARDVEPGVYALIFPVEREANLGRRLGKARPGDERHGQRAGNHGTAGHRKRH